MKRIIALFAVGMSLFATQNSAQARPHIFITPPLPPVVVIRPALSSPPVYRDYPRYDYYRDYDYEDARREYWYRRHHHRHHHHHYRDWD